MSRRKSNEVRIDQAIEQFLGSRKLIKRYHEIGLLRQWETVMGPVISKHTTALDIKNSVLLVTLDSAPLRQELSMSKEQVVRRLNEECGRQVINSVKFL